MLYYGYMYLTGAMKMSKNLTINDACTIAGISRAMLYKLWRIGKGPALIKIGRRTFISSTSLEEWLKSIEQNGNA